MAEKKQATKKDRTLSNIHWVLVIAAVCTLVYLGIFVITFFNQNLSHNINHWDAFGSAIGGFIGTILSAIVVFLVYETYRLQKQEINELVENAEQQNEYAKSNNFQGLFTMMMDVHLSNVNSLKIETNLGKLSGKDVIYFSLSEYLGVLEQLKKKQFNIVDYRRDTMIEKQILDAVCSLSEEELMKVVLLAIYYGNYHLILNKKSFVVGFVNKKIDDKYEEIIDLIYNNMFYFGGDGYKDRHSHYLIFDTYIKHIYLTCELIISANVDEDEKDRYMIIYTNSLTEVEKTLLFYTKSVYEASYSNYGKYLTAS